MTDFGRPRQIDIGVVRTSCVPVNAQVFNDVLSEYLSDPIDTSGYRKFLLRMILTVAGTPTTIQIKAHFSHGGGTYEQLMRAPYGSIMYEDAAGAKSECIDGDCLDDFMKVGAVAIGTSDVNIFTLTCKLTLIR